MVEGRPFTVYTDQQALVPAVHKKAEPLTQRQTYQLSCIAEMTTDIQYIQGKANFVADALSRPNGTDVSSVQLGQQHLFADLIQHNCLPDIALIAALNPAYAPETNESDIYSHSSDEFNISANLPPIGTIPVAELNAGESDAIRILRPNTPIAHVNKPLDTDRSAELNSLIGAIHNYGIDLSEMAAEQPLDVDYRRISNDPQSGLSFRKIDVGNRDILVDVSNGTPRPFVPFSWRRKIFEAVHGLGHPGVHRTQQTMAERFVWPSIKADVARWARECIPCQQSKVNRHVTPPIGTFEVPSRRFSHLNLDIVSLPSSNGFNHLLTIVDRLTRWPVAIPITDITAETVADAFAQGWVATYGIPVAITTDRGSQFSSSIWTQLMKQWGIRPLMTTAYHPEANGLVERLHRRLKEALLALCSDSPNQWFWKLPLALLAIRTTLKPDIGASPADMVFGEGLALPGDLLQSQDPQDDQLQRRQASTLANLRVEVARLQPTPTSAHRTPRVFMPQSLETATHVFVRRGGVQASFQTPYEGPYRIASRTATGFRVRFPGGRTELIALNRLKPAHVSSERPADEEPQDLDDDQPPSPNPPGRRPGVRTRIPEPTTRQTRSTSRRQQQSRNDGGAAPTTPTIAPKQTGLRRPSQHPRRAAAGSNPQPDWPVAAPPAPQQSSFQRPSTTVGAPSSKVPAAAPDSSKSQPRQRVPNIDEYNRNAGAPIGNPAREIPESNIRRNEHPPEQPTVFLPAPTSAANERQHSSTAASSQDELFVGDNEPRRETNFFASLEATTASDGAVQPGPSLPRLTSALRSTRPPTGSRVRFSDQRHRDPEQSRRYFSDTSRPRPNVSAITATILAHLQESE